MFSKIVVCIVAFAIAASVQELEASHQSNNKYPAGLHPNLCPNYPYCDNAALGEFAQGVAALHHDVAPGYPASLPPHACPNYPFCSHEIPHEAIHYKRHHQAGFIAGSSYPYAEASLQKRSYIAPSAQHTPAKYPSGVNPSSCPNYPYCN